MPRRRKGELTPLQEQRRDDLFDMLANKPDGMTITEIRQDLGGLSRRLADDAIRHLRLMMGETHDINVVTVRPDKGTGEWTYRLVGGLNDSQEYIKYRIDDVESRLRTVNSITKSLVAATTKETKQGRRVRVMDRQITRLVEDLIDIDT